MQSKTFGLVLTASEPISHHDPATGNDSNVLTFNRQKQFVDRQTSDIPIYRHLVDAICQQNPMPETVDGLLSRLTAPEWLSVAYIRLLLDIHNAGDGEGLLAGMERYHMLENRMQTAAIRSHTLHGFWSNLTDSLQLGTHRAAWDDVLTAFWTLPPSIQYQMLGIMAQQHRAIQTLARVWHTANKRQDQEYCESAKLPYAPERLEIASFDQSDFPDPPGQIVMEVPAISVNSIRHQLVREPAFLHLCNALGIEPVSRGQGALPISVESIFYNGGNIEAGAKQPNNRFFLGGEIRRAYPSLDLLGGVTSSFDIGESKLKVSAWIICAENADALPAELRNTAQAQTSIFDMLDEMVRTRQATDSGAGQMIYNYEVLVKGTQIYVELTLTPYTTDLAEGALAAALGYYAKNVNIVGGQSARGHGHMDLEWLTEMPDHLDEYEGYLGEHKDDLLAGMLDGTLTSGVKVCK